ncbi:hypothetical protein SpCBS45565_g02666 [Spizellomyces sp. 'palustris']|nr:hypothetical protein SpCBS45565_g02666 [Spizellomyces sp. 'palustris']
MVVLSCFLDKGSPNLSRQSLGHTLLLEHRQGSWWGWVPAMVRERSLREEGWMIVAC